MSATGKIRTWAERRGRTRALVVLFARTPVTVAADCRVRPAAFFPIATPAVHAHFPVYNVRKKTYARVCAIHIDRHPKCHESPRCLDARNFFFVRAACNSLDNVGTEINYSVITYACQVQVVLGNICSAKTNRPNIILSSSRYERCTVYLLSYPIICQQLCCPNDNRLIHNSLSEFRVTALRRRRRLYDCCTSSVFRATIRVSFSVEVVIFNHGHEVNHKVYDCRTRRKNTVERLHSYRRLIVSF